MSMMMEVYTLSRFLKKIDFCGEYVEKACQFFVMCWPFCYCHGPEEGDMK